jgi:phosphotransferase system HPr (HPr) family protein
MDGESVSRMVTVGLENGLHLVPCSRLVKLAMGFPCTVRLRKGSLEADLKNIFDLMSLAAEFGQQLELVATGAGAQEAVVTIAKLFETNFAES